MQQPQSSPGGRSGQAENHRSMDREVPGDLRKYDRDNITDLGIDMIWETVDKESKMKRL